MRSEKLKTAKFSEDGAKLKRRKRANLKTNETGTWWEKREFVSAGHRLLVEHGELWARQEHGRGRKVKPNRTELKKNPPFYLNDTLVNIVSAF